MPEKQPEPTLDELEAAEKLYNELRAVDLTKLYFEPNDPVGMYWNEIKKVKPVTPEEEPEVLARYIGGDQEDERELCERNLWLAFLIAFKYQDSGRQMLDLISEGNLGLLRAVEEYDPAKVYRFSAFVTQQINQAIVLFLQKSEAVTKVEIFDEVADVSNTEMTLQEAVRSVLEDLPEREREVLRLRFNLDEDENRIPKLEQ